MTGMGDANSPDCPSAEVYFDRFVHAFSTFDAARVADLFATPGVALRGDGSLAGLTERDDVVRYYKAALDKYYRDGCRSCRWSRLTVVPIGHRSLLATVTWELLRDDGAVVARWRQSYCLTRLRDGELRAFASATHAD